MKTITTKAYGKVNIEKFKLNGNDVKVEVKYGFDHKTYNRTAYIDDEYRFWVKLDNCWQQVNTKAGRSYINCNSAYGYELN